MSGVMLYLVPCNAMAQGRMVAEDRGLVAVHEYLIQLYLCAGSDTTSSNSGNPAIATGVKLYGGLPGGIHGLGAMSVPQISAALSTDEMKLHLATWPPEKQKEQAIAQDMARNGVNIHLSEHDPQHHAWAKHGADKEHMKLRILLSYWYYKDTDLDALFAKYFTQPYPDVFADSGAYSAMTQGSPVDIDAYAAWIKRWRHLFAVYANLDVIKDAKATWENQRYLEDKHNLTPLPCFHVLEDFRWLERYVESYPYIALGVAGMQSRRDAIMAWIVKCFRVAGAQSVFHGFALTSWDVMKSFPWYSVDSSSWGSGFRYGQVPLFDSHRGRFEEIRLGDYISCKKHTTLIRELGFEPLDFADRKRNDRAKICAISALSYMKAEQWLRKRHGEIQIPGREGAQAVLLAHLVTAQSGPDAEHGSNMSLTALAQAGLGNDPGVNGIRLHLADTSNGINYGDAEKGLRLHLADARGHSGGDLAAAGTGIRTYLADSPHTPYHEAAYVDAGLKVHLAEHSLDRGGVGDTSRAMEVIQWVEDRE